jgi:hypothetical protein
MNTTQLENKLNIMETRVRNTEEALAKLVTLYSNLVSNKQVQELIAAISDELKENREELTSIRSRVEILEDIPDIDF